MLETVISKRSRERFKIYGRGRLGKCLICDDRVRKSQSYVTTSEGYTHKECLKDWREGEADAK